MDSLQKLRMLYATDGNMGGFVARLALGIVVLPHGLQKLLGMYGGGGFAPTVEFFGSIGIPSFVAALIILGESLGAAALIVGVFSRFCAAAISVIMLGAVFMAHLPNGFFMNWFGNKAGEGYEYHILAIGLGLVVTTMGAGRHSVDRILSERL